MEQQLRHQYIQRDLLLILCLVVFMLFVLSALKYADTHYGVIDRWSHAFYQFVLRQK
ncbi:MAG: hypothetical protein HYV32_01940 [Candidatus Kerfeldbacteria bacterium]|nr:hypothetical protein [Candidatus Kerfeldbacteria bacterium]